MIFTIIDFALALYLLSYGFRLRFRGAESDNARLIFYYCVLAATLAFAIGAGYAAAGALSPGLATFLIRVGAVAVTATHLIVFLLALSFPYERRFGFLRFPAAILWAVSAYFILFTDRYLQTVSLEAGTLHQTRGPLFLPIVVGGFSLGLLSALLLLLRRLFFKSKIFRLQTLIVAFGLGAGYVVTFLMAVVLPAVLDRSWIYVLMPAGGTLLALILGYGVSITRLLDVRTVVVAALASVLFHATVGAVAGVLFALGRSVLGPLDARLLAPAAAAVYLAVHRLGLVLRSRFSARLRGRDIYAERLEEGLAAIDFVKGRDSVIGEFINLMRSAVDCSSVHLMIENAQGRLVRVGSTSPEADDAPAPAVERPSPALDFLLNGDVSILLKTEIVTNYDYHEVKAELLELLEKFDAEAMVLLREGRTLIGALFVGSKRSGGDFLDYDYQTLRRVYGKIFVVAYYLKNIAQESLVVTVDRELEYSEQIIQSIQENLDRIEHPAADIAYMTRSTRKLGGDFIDFMRLTADRYVFVLGDVSGKGLNASMSMVILKSVVRTFLRETKDFKELVIRTNGFIKNNLPRGTFFAGVLGLFDFKARTLYYVNCGIPAMFLLSSSYNNPVEIQGAGKVLGFVKDIAPHITVRKASFKRGDLLLMTTDGLTDAESLRGVRFGKERIQKSIQENRSASAERVVQFLYNDVVEFVSQELNDDISILTIKFN